VASYILFDNDNSGMSAQLMHASFFQYYHGLRVGRIQLCNTVKLNKISPFIFICISSWTIGI